MDAAMNSTVAKLTAALPTLNPNEATAVLQVAVPITVRGAARFLEELATHLSEHPDALTSGETRCPPVLIRLTHVLHDSGHHVVRPGCAHCGKTVVELRQLRPEGRVWEACDGRSRRSTCSRCGQHEVRIAARRPDEAIELIEKSPFARWASRNGGSVASAYPLSNGVPKRTWL